MSCKSMTGFGQAVLESMQLSVKAEIRSVNHRFIEFNIRMPRELFVLEDTIRKSLSNCLARGHVDVYVTIDTAKVTKRVVVDWDVLDGFMQAREAAYAKYGLSIPDDRDLSQFLMQEKTVSVETIPLEAEFVGEQVKRVIDEAALKLVEMRTREGHRICTDLLAKLDGLMQIVYRMQEWDKSASDSHRERILKRINQLQLEVDESRLLTEVALVVDRFAIDEEVVRLLSHIDEFKRTLTNDGPIGRRLDFIVQEMHREVNTIGSKSQDLQVSKAVVDAKVIVEQLREQAQNIE